jgi:electron transfer DM13
MPRLPSFIRDRWRLLWPHWWELAPEVVLVGGLTFFLIDEPDAATSSFDSLRAVGLIVGVTVAWLAARLVLARVVPWSMLRMAVFGVAAVYILLVVVFPAYDEETVVEAFPGAPAAVEPRDEPEAVTTTTPAEPADPELLRTGMFEGIDHRAAGTVSIYRRADGTVVVGLERFDIQPGPDYDVYVVPGDDQEARDGGTRLDDLRGNQGTQYYDVPARLAIDEGPWTVLIWCQTFGVPVANSTPLAV